uniref:Transmembrane protein n=1 Tax=Globodera pallida TaxID=36090 RepID=A0A183BUY8_GLOPA
MFRRPLPTAAVLLLLCFFFALLLLLPSQGNAFWCGYGQRTESVVEYKRTQQECEPRHIACFLASCSSGKQQWFSWGCGEVTRNEDSDCISNATGEMIKELPSDRPWLCDCTFSKKGESVDMGPPDLPSTTTKAPPVPRSTTTTTKGSRTAKSGGGRPFVKTHYLLFALQMIFGFVPAIFVGLSGRTV